MSEIKLCKDCSFEFKLYHPLWGCELSACSNRVLGKRIDSVTGNPHTPLCTTLRIDGYDCKHFQPRLTFWQRINQWVGRWRYFVPSHNASNSKSGGGGGMKAANEILAELVALKHIKDTQGKTPEYLERQPKAWEKAEKYLATLGEV